MQGSQSSTCLTVLSFEQTTIGLWYIGCHVIVATRGLCEPKPLAPLLDVSDKNHSVVRILHSLCPAEVQCHWRGAAYTFSRGARRGFHSPKRAFIDVLFGGKSLNRLHSQPMVLLHPTFLILLKPQLRGRLEGLCLNTPS